MSDPHAGVRARETLRLVSPVPALVALEVAGSAPWRRKLLIHSTRRRDAIAIMRGETPIAIAMFEMLERRPRRFEIAMAFTPAARAEVRGICRFAQLTLGRMREAGFMVFAHVAESNRPGRRIARAAGFVAAGLADRSIWIFRGNRR
ncbi:MAG: hypothetical protein KF723_22980 [Rhizobiaceae bacterium]|nr:hypothetical protein [Rhizobiaceae bacterium]